MALDPKNARIGQNVQNGYANRARKFAKIVWRVFVAALVVSAFVSIAFFPAIFYPMTSPTPASAPTITATATMPATVTPVPTLVPTMAMPEPTAIPNLAAEFEQSFHTSTVTIMGGWGLTDLGGPSNCPGFGSPLEKMVKIVSGQIGRDTAYIKYDPNAHTGTLQFEDQTWDVKLWDRLHLQNGDEVVLEIWACPTGLFQTIP